MICVTGSARRRQVGLTLIELMIAITLSLLVLLAATGLLLAVRAAYLAQDQIEQIQETGRYATQILARAIRQTGYEYRDAERAAFAVDATLSANVIGLDAMTLKKNGAALSSATSSGVINDSDVLALRFFGDDDGNDADNAILNCAGLAVPAAGENADPELARGWSIFFLAKDNAGEPELRCKYQTKSGGWNADAIARGVESFQVLYGIDTQDDDAPDQFLNADGIDGLDAGLALNGNDTAERMQDLNRKTYWKKVRAVRFALLVRGGEAARDDAGTEEYDLFDPAYTAMHGEDDRGVHLAVASMPSLARKRIRKLFSQTIQLRNDAAGAGT
ncbi:MAG TPA: PilW family protein [Oxalicibacterium sp.]|nr:PilW family protein [Oxalicibacterium sp.]